MELQKKQKGKIRQALPTFQNSIWKCIMLIVNAEYEDKPVLALKMLLLLIDLFPNKLYKEVEKDVNKIRRELNSVFGLDGLRKTSPSYMKTRKLNIMSFIYKEYRPLLRKAITLLDDNNLLVQYGSTSSSNVNVPLIYE